MSTRGAFGFRVDGQDKIMYNHWDSYIDGLGQTVMEFIKETSDEELKKIADNIVLVDGDKTPTTAQKKAVRDFEKANGTVVSDISVSTRTLDDWYCLLRNAQGELEMYKKGLEYMISSESFLQDSLFCEYAYIINIDTGMLEVYFGFNKEPDAAGRYAKFKAKDYNDEYYGVALVKEIPFDEIRKDIKKVLAKLLNLDAS